MRPFLAALSLFPVFLIQNSFSATLSSNGTLADIMAKQALAQNGDTITIPAGTFIWTTAVNITKAITLQGAGVGVTIVKDAGGLPHWTLVAGQISRMTGIEFQDGGRVTQLSEGIISVSGSNTNGSTFRWDHCKFNQINGYPLFKNAIGVVDHCTFITSTAQPFIL